MSRSAVATLDTFDVIEAIKTASKSVYRLEQQPLYRSDFYPGHYERWLADDPVAVADTPDYPEWLAIVEAVTGRGVDMTRVRVLEDPPTEVNRWSQWKGQANTQAGETVLYVSRSTVEGVGVSSDDWWLIDGTTLLLMSFDSNGVFTGGTVTTDTDAVTGTLSQWEALCSPE